VLTVCPWQADALEEWAAEHDIIITTAVLASDKAPPVLITDTALAKIRPGSVVVDLAASWEGGNVAQSKVDEAVVTKVSDPMTGQCVYRVTLKLNSSRHLTVDTGLDAASRDIPGSEWGHHYWVLGSALSLGQDFIPAIRVRPK